MNQVKEDNRALEQAQAQLESITDMIARHKDAHKAYEYSNGEVSDALDESVNEIEEYALEARIVKRYEILLSTGGPATKIEGQLNEYNEPESVSLLYQDWFTGWEAIELTKEQAEALLAFAQHYFFGE